MRALLKRFQPGAGAARDSLATGLMFVIEGKHTCSIPVPELGFNKQILL